MTDTPDHLIKTIRRKTRRKHEPEEKIHIILEACVARSRLQNCAAKKVLRKASIQLEQGVFRGG